MTEKLRIGGITFIPISAKSVDNVIMESEHMPWYDGGILLNLLETAPVRHSLAEEPMRMPVQHVIRPISDRFHDLRGYAGRLCGGVLHRGDAVVVFPSESRSTVEAIRFAEEEKDEAFAPESVTVCLADDIDISRGDLIVARRATATRQTLCHPAGNGKNRGCRQGD